MSNRRKAVRPSPGPLVVPVPAPVLPVSPVFVRRPAPGRRRPPGPTQLDQGGAPPLLRSGAPVLNRLNRVRVKLAVWSELRSELVAEARAAGHTWAEIGQALGVSPQVAHRKYSAPR